MSRLSVELQSSGEILAKIIASDKLVEAIAVETELSTEEVLKRLLTAKSTVANTLIQERFDEGDEMVGFRPSAAVSRLQREYEERQAKGLSKIPGIQIIL